MFIHSSKHKSFVSFLQARYRLYQMPLFLCCILFLCAACGTSVQAYHPTTVSSAPWHPESGIISFKAATSYTSALRTITDLGLQPTWPCISTKLASDGSVASWIAWHQMGNKDFFTSKTTQARMWFTTTALSSPDWLKRLQAQADVSSVRTKVMMYCPMIHAGSPPSNTVIALAPQQAGKYIRITFTGPLKRYDDALYIVNNLGLRLADPNYEYAKNKPGWHDMGQEQSFSQTHTLLVATTAESPTNWQQQLKLTQGVTFAITSSR
ncbi:hypothetical protein EPA93_39630 [Ktedonosporobacter rubrisoli]|uniref:Uncharacterized protein n=1 Tax=Ktedonosporobacter rubrisoli TaxID=2509675 RepID=A0A4V0Z027_KTERU|nr:hypothetical protein [Ktedonosporobacter rubrisoli]QBD81761.1 hypothetical protein EPA93_39630 [Ktedonosporobacter rubrisoli]